jgi:N-acetylmuramoyl-L-alanine amidase
LFISLHANAAFDRRARGVELYFQNNLPPEEEEMFLAHLENNSRGAEAKKQISKNIFALSKKSDINTIIEDLKHQSRLRKSLQATQLIAKSWAESEDGAKSKITIKQAPFFVVSQTSMPSMLIEIGFLSHPTDYKKLMDHQYQNQIIGKIHQALNIYKEKVDKKQQHSLD